MTGRHTRRWFASIPITGRFYIMLAILVLAEVGLVTGCLHAMNLQTEASADLARVAAVQRSLDRALTLHGNISAELQDAATTPSTTPNSLVSALRAQLDLTWALPANAEVATITDALRTPGAQYLESVEDYVRQGGGAGGATAWAFADLEPRRVALEAGLRDAMTPHARRPAARRNARVVRSGSIRTACGCG